MKPSRRCQVKPGAGDSLGSPDGGEPILSSDLPRLSRLFGIELSEPLQRSGLLQAGVAASIASEPEQSPCAPALLAQGDLFTWVPSSAPLARCARMRVSGFRDCVPVAGWSRRNGQPQTASRVEPLFASLLSWNPDAPSGSAGGSRSRVPARRRRA